MKEVEKILRENKRRIDTIQSVWNPITGEGHDDERFVLRLSDFALPTMWLPIDMKKVKVVKLLIKYGSINDAIEKGLGEECTEAARETFIKMFIRTRIKYDFPFWCYYYVVIKPKDTSRGGDDIPFRLNRQQRRLILKYEEQRRSGRPIRLVLAKSRQWGGSTVTQIYMAWLQLVHRKGLNSLIVGHQKDACAEVEGMFIKLINAYPTELLYGLSEAYNPSESKFVGDHTSMNIHHIPQRNCKVKVGSAEKPDSARGGDAALVHCTEVAFWKKTEGKTPEQIVRSACGGVQPVPYTMIVYESSPNGSGNFFEREYHAAKDGSSQFTSLFVAWWQIETYAIPLDNKEEFAQWLYDNRENENVMSNREESGKYYWYLWTLGATLEALHWYKVERGKYTAHEDMAAEYPSDDKEAFLNSGNRVFSEYKVADFRSGCRSPKYIGDVYGDSEQGDKALDNVRFTEDNKGQLWIWSKPEIDEEEVVKNRYLVVVDIGGRGSHADWSVICVFDRYWMMEGDKPSVVAQWYGHIDMDLLAWKSAAIAKYYDNALLVIESNTLETKDRDRMVDGDQSMFILNQIKEHYDNLYARHQSEDEIREHAPVKYGFHTNVATKPMIISNLIKVVREHLYIERDARCLDEFLDYERKQNGAYGAILGKHDDLLMTRAIGLHICFNEMDMPTIVHRHHKSKLHKNAVSAASI